MNKKLVCVRVYTTFLGSNTVLRRCFYVDDKPCPDVDVREGESLTELEARLSDLGFTFLWRDACLVTFAREEASSG